MKDIAEWLVRCAEQPATRWEGVYELAESARLLPDDSAEPEEDEDTDDLDTPAVVSKEQAGEALSTSDKPESNPNMITLLTDQQKERLMAILFSVETLTQKDMQLVELAKSWKDARLVSYLVSQLRRVESNPPPIAEEIMAVIAAMLKDENISRFASEYGDNVSYEDLNRKDGEDAEVYASEPPDDEQADTEKIDAATALQQRTAMVQRFIAMVEQKMSNR